jgi:hypothetical protein
MDLPPLITAWAHHGTIGFLAFGSVVFWLANELTNKTFADRPEMFVGCFVVIASAVPHVARRDNRDGILAGA